MYVCLIISPCYGTLEIVIVIAMTVITDLLIADVCVCVRADLWSRYVSVFGGLWAASAFKGATGPCAVATDIGYHIENHKQWINVVAADIRPLTDKFYGFALTGWQRYVLRTCT